MRRRITFGLLLSLLIIVSLSSPRTPRSSAQINTVNQYAAKFVCGKTDGPLAAAGNYFTIINVHNPSTITSPKGTVRIWKKFALGEKDEHVGRISPYCETSLEGDEVMGIDCPNIYKHLGLPEGTFIEGFAVIQANKELDIVSVYTAGQDHIEAFHTERVPFRKVQPVCSDLNLNINTGFSQWKIISDPISSTTEPRAQSLITVPAPSWASLSTSAWIGPFINAGLNPANRGDYVYELHFCLCSGFGNAKLDLKGLADDRATVFLNDVALSPTIPGPNSSTAIQAGAPFQVGDNKLKVVVTNLSLSVTGLNINGSITATAGRCPTACENPGPKPN